MTKDEAQALRAARGTDAKLLSRKPRYELAAIFCDETGTISPINRYSKDELVSGILDAHYPLAREHEAIHVLHHDVIWPDCEHCQAEQAAHSDR